MLARSFALIVILTTLAAATSGSAREAAGRAAGLKALVGARLIDGKGNPPIENGVLLLREGLIAGVGPFGAVEIPPGAERIDVSGKTIMPGIINAHGHVGGTRGLLSGPEHYSEENILSQLGLYARYGVTTVFSLGDDQERAVRLRDAQEGPGLDRSRIYLAGPVVTAASPQEARRKVGELAAMKVDFVKIRVDDNLGTRPKMPEPAYRAVIEEAHRQGLRVAAHVYYLEDAKSLLRSGVDFLAHSVRDREVDSELIGLLKEREVCLCPTLTREVSTFVYESTPEFFADPFFLRETDPEVLAQLKDPERQEKIRNDRAAQQYKRALEVASRNLKTLADSGVRIAFGTDTGPPARFQGYFEHMELSLMAKAGLSPMQIVLAATGDAAACTEVAGRLGTLEVGKWADLVVLRANPLADIANTRTIESVWIAGNRVPPRKPPLSGRR